MASQKDASDGNSKRKMPRVSRVEREETGKATLLLHSPVIHHNNNTSICFPEKEFVHTTLDDKLNVLSGRLTIINILPANPF